MCAKKAKEITETQQNAQGQKGSPQYIVIWTVILILGMTLEFIARVFGYDQNPFGYFHPLIPAFTGILAALIILTGYFMLVSKKAKLDSLVKRNGVLCVILGIMMLACFFIFKEAIPNLFG